MVLVLRHSIEKSLYICNCFVRVCFQSVDSRLISSKSLVACIVPTTRTSLPKRIHIWELFNEYYGMKVSEGGVGGLYDLKADLHATTFVRDYRI